MFKDTCPDCGHILSFEDEQAGQMVACDRCGRTFFAGGRGAEESWADPYEKAAAETEKRARHPMITIAVCLAIFLSGVVLSLAALGRFPFISSGDAAPTPPKPVSVRVRPAPDAVKPIPAIPKPDIAKPKAAPVKPQPTPATPRPVPSAPVRRAPAPAQPAPRRVVSFPKSTVESSIVNGRIVDRIDYPFVRDPAVIGTWQSVAFVASPEQFDPAKQNAGTPLHLAGIIIHPDGTTDGPWFWTRGLIIHRGDSTAAQYHLETIGQTIYMYFEWKSGDYTIRHQQPRYYVLRKTR